MRCRRDEGGAVEEEAGSGAEWSRMGAVVVRVKRSERITVG